MENPTKLFLLIVSIAAVMFIAGCGIEPLIEHISIGTGCGESNLGELRCGNNGISVQQCAKIGESYSWTLSADCDSSQGMVCGLTSDDTISCVSGCIYTDPATSITYGLKIGDVGCSAYGVYSGGCTADADGNPLLTTTKCTDNNPNQVCQSDGVTAECVDPPAPIDESQTLEGVFTLTSDEVLTTTPGCSYADDSNFDPLKKGSITIPPGLYGNPILQYGPDTYVGQTTTEECNPDVDGLIPGQGFAEYYCDANSYAHKANGVCVNGCLDGACVACIDTDGGADYFVSGTTTGVTGGPAISTFQDCCVMSSDPTNQCVAEGDTLVEWSCKDVYVEGQAWYKCPSGKCMGGACMNACASDADCEPGKICEKGGCLQPCNDSDGSDYYNKGTVSGYDDPTMNYVTVQDECQYNSVKEYVCDGVYGRETELECANGCFDGACICTADTDCGSGKWCWEGLCVSGCLYEGNVYEVGIKGCINDSTYAECANKDVIIQDCSPNGICDAQASGCIPGCLYEGVGYDIGVKGCLNETTYGECTSSGAIFEDCSANGQTCQEGNCTVEQAIIPDNTTTPDIDNTTTPEPSTTGTSGGGGGGGDGIMTRHSSGGGGIFIGREIQTPAGAGGTINTETQVQQTAVFGQSAPSAQPSNAPESQEMARAEAEATAESPSLMDKVKKINPLLIIGPAAAVVIAIAVGTVLLVRRKKITKAPPV